MNNAKHISIIIPCRDELQNIVPLFDALEKELLTLDHEVFFIDDGSRDGTKVEIQKIQRQYPDIVKYIFLTKSFGQYNAILAGLRHASGTYIVVMDADLQHPPNVIPKMLEAIDDKTDIVMAIREYDRKEGLIRLITSGLFKIIFNILSDVNLIDNSSDFCLFNRKVLSFLLSIRDNVFFLRYHLKLGGFQEKFIHFRAPVRQIGRSKYSMTKKLTLSLNAIISASIKPLRISLFLGLLASLFAFLIIFITVVQYFMGRTLSGYATIVSGFMLLGGLQLIVLGIIGEYLGRLFQSVKELPNYVIDEKSFD